MSHSYTLEQPVFDQLITLPDDGDHVVGASVNVALEALADRERYLVQFYPLVRDYSVSNVAYGTLVGGTNQTVWTDVLTVATNGLQNAATIPAVKWSDILRVSFSFYAKSTATDCFSCRLVIKNRGTGLEQIVPYTQVPALIDMDSAPKRLQYTVYAETQLDDSGILTNDLDVVLQAKAESAYGSTLEIYTPTLARVSVSRRIRP